MDIDRNSVSIYQRIKTTYGAVPHHAATVTQVNIDQRELTKRFTGPISDMSLKAGMIAGRISQGRYLGRV